MRLFIAINFPDSVKRNLAAVNTALAAGAAHGSFTLPENFHLTLAFIGESTQTELLSILLDRLPKKSFDLTVRSSGAFRQDRGDLLWRGFAPSAELDALVEALREKLRTAGFPVDSRPFRPHITLCRSFVPRHGFDPKLILNALPAEKFHVSRISLMKSERLKGRLVYTELYGCDFA